MKEETAQWFYRNVTMLKEDMFRFAFSILHHAQDSEDAVANAVIRAHDHIGQLRKRDAFRVWYTKIVRNECYRILRDRKRTAAISGNEMNGEVCEPCESIDVQRALFQLPEDRRTALTLYYLCGYTVAEIAQVMQIPEGTVKSRLSRGRAELREKLGGKTYVGS